MYCISLLSRLPYEEIARDRILHSQIMEVQAALRCTGGAAAWRGNGRVSTKESGSSRFSRSAEFFCGSRVSERTGRDLHADLRAGSNRLISNRFGPWRVSPPFSPFLRPLPSSPIHVHFPFFFFALRLRCPPRTTTPLSFPLFLAHLYRVPLFLPFLFRSPAFCNLDTEKIKKTLY